MANELGRSDFLEAATAIKRLSAMLTGKRKEIDDDLSFFANAGKALGILAEGDRSRGELQAKISEAEVALADISGRVSAAEDAAKKSVMDSSAAVKKAQDDAAGLIAEAKEKGRAASKKISELDASVAAAEKEAKGKIKALDAQIAGKEAALASLRETIAQLANL